MINNLVTMEQKDLSSQLKVIGLNDFLSLNLPPREFVLSPWLPVGGLCQLHAFRGCGKTHMSLGIAYAVASGGNFLGWFADKPRGVLFIDGEMPARSLQERFANIVLMNGSSHIDGTLNILTPDLQVFGIPDLATPEGQAIINQYITEAIDLIILDNLSSLIRSGKENDASDWMPVQSWILSLRAKGKSVLLIHHTGKNGTQRGCSKREDVLDTVIILEKPKDYEERQGARFIVKYEKARGFFGDDAKPFEAKLYTDEKGHMSWKRQSLEESSYEKVIALANDGVAQKDIVIDLQLSKGTVSKYVKRGRDEGRLTKQLKENNDE